MAVNGSPSWRPLCRRGASTRNTGHDAGPDCRQLLAAVDSTVGGQLEILYKAEVQQAARLRIDGSLNDAVRGFTLRSFCLLLAHAAVVAGGASESCSTELHNPPIDDTCPLFGKHGGQSAAALATQDTTSELHTFAASAAASTGARATKAFLEHRDGLAAVTGATLVAHVPGDVECTVSITAMPWGSTLYIAVAGTKRTTPQDWFDYFSSPTVLV